MEASGGGHLGVVSALLDHGVLTLILKTLNPKTKNRKTENMEPETRNPNPKPEPLNPEF